jgi:hypothetical protein
MEEKVIEWKSVSKVIQNKIEIKTLLQSSSSPDLA